jgi:hypothetical protein
MSAPELRRPLAADRVRGAGLDRRVTATEVECQAVAARLQIPAVLALECDFHLEPEAGGAVQAEGVLRARLLRECVVTLEPFETATESRFRLRFVPQAAPVRPPTGGVDDDEDLESEAEAVDPESEDEVPFEGAFIDLGEAAVEQLALELDPYPRSPGAALPPLEGEDPAPASPFAALARRTRE